MAPRSQSVVEIREELGDTVSALGGKKNGNISAQRLPALQTPSKTLDYSDKDKSQTERTQ